jgi:hypothetical protein
LSSTAIGCGCRRDPGLASIVNSDGTAWASRRAAVYAIAWPRDGVVMVEQIDSSSRVSGSG